MPDFERTSDCKKGPILEELQPESPATKHPAVTFSPRGPGQINSGIGTALACPTALELEAALVYVILNAHYPGTLEYRKPQSTIAWTFNI